MGCGDGPDEVLPGEVRAVEPFLEVVRLVVMVEEDGGQIGGRDGLRVGLVGHLRWWRGLRGLGGLVGVEGVCVFVIVAVVVVV